MTGLTDGEGGMASPNLGVLAPLFCRLPGMGGRNSGAGDDILGWVFESREFVGLRMLAFSPLLLRRLKELNN